MCITPHAHRLVMNHGRALLRLSEIRIPINRMVGILPTEASSNKPDTDLRIELAQLLGTDRITAAKGIAVLLPILVRGIKGAVQADPLGLHGFLTMLRRICEPDLLASNSTNAETAVRKGQMLLAEILGPKEIGLAVVADASRTSGLDHELLDRMFPAIAVLLAQEITQEAAQISRRLKSRSRLISWRSSSGTRNSDKARQIDLDRLLRSLDVESYKYIQSDSSDK